MDLAEGVAWIGPNRFYRQTRGKTRWCDRTVAVTGVSRHRLRRKELNRGTGVTIVLVEQNIDMIRAMAQRCYVMDKGRLIAELTPDMLDDRETVRRYLSV